MKNKGRTATYAATTVLCIIATAAAAFAAVALAWYVQLASCVEYNGWKTYTGDYEQRKGILWAVILIGLGIAVASIIISVMKSGKRLPEGGVRIHWYDKIFMEAQIVGVIAAFVVFLIAVRVVYCLMSVDEINSFFIDDVFYGEIVTSAVKDGTAVNSTEMHNFMDLSDMVANVDDPENWWVNPDTVITPWPVHFILAVLGTVAPISFVVYAVHSFARKLKARKFWRYSIGGTIAWQISRHDTGSGKVFGKVMRRMTLAALIPLGVGLVVTIINGAMAPYMLSAFPFIFGLISTAVLEVLIVWKVPPKIRKYEEVRKGVAEVASGNLSYKVPLEGNGEFERAAADVNRISDAISKAVENELRNHRMKTELISNVSHDLRTPITSMVAYVDLLKKEGLDSENAPEYLSILDEKTNRLRTLTDDLFEAAKASSGDIPVSLTKIDLAAFVEQSVSELGERLEENDIEVVVTPRTDRTAVMADGRQLYRVMENLLTNIAKYAMPGSRAYIDIKEKVYETDPGTEAVLATPRRSVVLEVKNVSRDRLNIAPEELMERFTRGDDSRNTEGSGLGLAIARDLTTLMGGRFDLMIDGDLFKAQMELPAA